LLQKQGRARETLDLVNGFVAKHPDDAIALNERCWTKATLNIQIETALADCNASLKLAPESPATLDSRAFIRLRLGDNDAAIADYDAALRLSPGQAASLYGRAIARARKGDLGAARADLAAARAIADNIETRFAGFGVALPASLATASLAVGQGAPRN
jgi:tetratricopeptide (TPR) repeat protein